jgi:hypothetical protein
MRYWFAGFFVFVIMILTALFGCNKPPPECGDHEVWNGKECVCNSGYSRDDDGVCVPTCQGDHERWDGNQCVCEDGYFRDRGGVCQPIQPPPPPPETCELLCAPGQWAIVNNECRCSKDYYEDKRAQALHIAAQGWDARLINNGVRGPQFAFSNCGDAVLPYNGFAAWEEIWPVMEQSEAHKVKLFGPEGDEGFYANLLEPNRHGFTGRSMVYKPSAAPWFTGARLLLNGEKGTESNPKGPVSRLDGIKGKCEKLLEQ